MAFTGQFEHRGVVSQCAPTVAFASMQLHAIFLHSCQMQVLKIMVDNNVQNCLLLFISLSCILDVLLLDLQVEFWLTRGI